MRTRVVFWFSVVVLSSLPIAIGQSFVNLNFEQATVPPLPAGRLGDRVDPGVAFPGWTARAPNPWHADVIFYNLCSMSASAVVLMGPEYPNGPGVYPAIEGAYSALLQFPDGLNNPGDLPSLSQTGVIPSDARSITLASLFDADFARVTLDGIDIPLLPISGDIDPFDPFPVYHYGGDITAFAGRSVELVLTLSSKSVTEFYFDDISFLPTAVPEPAYLPWVGLAVLIFRIERSRKSRSAENQVDPG